MVDYLVWTTSGKGHQRIKHLPVYFEDTGIAYMYMYSIEIQKSLVKTIALSSNAHILKK